MVNPYAQLICSWLFSTVPLYQFKHEETKSEMVRECDQATWVVDLIGYLMNKNEIFFLIFTYLNIFYFFYYFSY